jgi:hypothetical protein
VVTARDAVDAAWDADVRRRDAAAALQRVKSYVDNPAIAGQSRFMRGPKVASYGQLKGPPHES